MAFDKTTGQWRNSRGLLALTFSGAVIMMVLAALLGMATLAMLIPFHASGLSQAFMLAMTCFGTAAGARQVWRMGREAARNTARFEKDGVHFYYGAKESGRIGWPEIVEVTHGGGANGQVNIQYANGELFSFNGYSFFLPSRLGKEIAARAGKEFHRFKPAEAGLKTPGA